MPEIEVLLVLSRLGKIIALSICNDMTLNSIEALGPLNLFWAKAFEGCCGIGPFWAVLEEDFPEDKVPSLDMELEIVRAGKTVFRATANFDQIKRNPVADIRRFVLPQFGEAMKRMGGMMITTGTAISLRKPVGWEKTGTEVFVNDLPDPQTLLAGDQVIMRIESLGALVQTVEMIDLGAEPNSPSDEMIDQVRNAN